MDKYMLILIESSASLLMFYIVYVLWLRKETFFTENRYFLLIAALISLLIPWLNFGNPFRENVEAETYFINLLDSITITAAGYEQQLVQQITAMQWILITYLLGVLIMVVLFVLKGFQIYLLDRKSCVSKEYAVNVRIIDKELAPFSFFKRIYINPEMHNESELDKIIAHENIHITQGHTIDCLFYELLIALFWFNPIVYRYRKSARAVHEFLADQGAIHSVGVSPKAYKHLLFEQATGIKELQLVNSFNYSLIKKRIIMLTKIKSSKRAKSRLLAFVPVLLSLLLVFTGEKANSRDNLNFDDTEVENTNREIRDYPTPQEDDKVYQIVDDMPKYPGGELALKKFIATNVIYPAKAKATGTEGRIFVSFVVNKVGGVEQVEYIATRVPVRDKNSIDEEVVVAYTEVFHEEGKDFESLREEAIRVTKTMPTWKPGKQNGKPVNIRFTIPINFQLN